ncbi:hypothetical protein EDD22DRAFT_759773, partial [Suillus occidentalis]
QDIICIANMQHNCLNVKCMDFSTKPLYQEQTQTHQMTSIIKHQQSPQYLLNSFSIHNYQHPHSLLPESL